jgi:ABC-type antimicrobial peptide transport system permease subunit
MIRNYFKITWRNLVKDKQFMLLNLMGLSTGLACTFLIYLWVADEMAMDKFHANKNRLYQVMKNGEQSDGYIKTRTQTPDLLAKALADAVPGIEEAVTLKFADADMNQRGILTYNNASIRAADVFATPNFFKAFSFKMLEGDAAHALSNPNSILLSRSTATKLFHTTVNVVGKVVKWDRGADSKALNGPYVVAGLFEDAGPNSSIQFDVLFSHAQYVANGGDNINWYSNNPSTYVLLKKGVDAKLVNATIKNFIKNRYQPGTNDYKWAGTLFLQPFANRYLYGRYEGGQPTGGRIDYVKLFSVIALFVLVIACINFMNLATARAARRMKEVGIKKVVGASRASLIVQYTGESVLMALLSLLGAAVLVVLMLPAFTQITGKSFNVFNGEYIVVAILIALITGVISGSYPAFYLSRFRPVQVLKGTITTSAGEGWVRRALVVFQFTVSAVLIIAVLVVYGQMELVQTKNLGYNKDNIIHFANEGNLGPDEQVFLAEARKLPGVANASDMEGDMFGNHSSGSGIDWPGKTGQLEFDGLYTDYDFMQTMGLQMQQGRMFSREYGADSDAVVFNETAIRMMHLQNPLGKTVTFWGNKKHIIGVVKDFNTESLYKAVGPFFISFRKNAENLLVKIKAGQERQTLAELETLYKKYNAGVPFEYWFMDEDYKTLYASEQRVSVLSRCFAALAIIISCLGLFGLAAFTAQKRQKEIGIRKVVGATVANVAVMLGKDFLRLVLISVLIAFPMAWWAMHSWLQSFAYRVNIGAGVFLTAAASIIAITICTVSFQAIKAAVANPVKALRSE